MDRFLISSIANTNVSLPGDLFFIYTQEYFQTQCLKCIVLDEHFNIFLLSVAVVVDIISTLSFRLCTLEQWRAGSKTIGC